MKKEQIKAMIGKAKNKVWLFLKKIYAKLPEKMKVHIRKLKPKEKIMLITNKTQNNRIQFLFGDTFKTGISSA